MVTRWMALACICVLTVAALNAKDEVLISPSPVFLHTIPPGSDNSSRNGEPLRPLPFFPVCFCKCQIDPKFKKNFQRPCTKCIDRRNGIFFESRIFDQQ